MIAFFWNVILALLWVALTGSFSGGNLLAGFVFGYLALAVMQRHIPMLHGYSQRAPRFMAFAVFFLKELFVANVRVAYDVITPVWYMKPGVIAMRLESKSDVEITLVANLISLTPGTLSLDVSDDRKVLYIHAMFMADEQELRDSLHELERRILRVLR
ncbi:Na+/H+ antiporter subunit E [Vreelandella utahensis]|uniref:Na+/H+ antiporter subunit E n=1 Tax=Vreelandella halophila TaxID=86177 RepID=UPI000985CB8F|nr:Na+/H+ antiporter subunit E [Halomonas utahensis]